MLFGFLIRIGEIEMGIEECSFMCNNRQEKFNGGTSFVGGFGCIAMGRSLWDIDFSPIKILIRRGLGGSRYVKFLRESSI